MGAFSDASNSLSINDNKESISLTVEFNRLILLGGTTAESNVLILFASVCGFNANSNVFVLSISRNFSRIFRLN